MKLVHGQRHPVFGRILASRENGDALVEGSNGLYVWIHPSAHIIAAHGDAVQHAIIAAELRRLRRAELGITA